MNKYHKIQDNSQIKSTLFRVDKSTHAEHFFLYFDLSDLQRFTFNS